ncbi:hypothetical protein T492DRAFT_1006349 [Pavlovales sp. CCMP2436]|nr:hypothetical protein T492DRAFT_1006349 [Pavlovales sp. CCMP2436]
MSKPVDYSKFDKVGDSDDEVAPPPRPPPSEELPSYTAPSYDDPRAQIEKLKADKRAARVAREAAEAAAGPVEGTAEKEVVVSVEAEAQAAAVAELELTGPLAMLVKAEGVKADIVSGVAGIEADLSTAQDEPIELGRVTALNGLIGKLQSLVDQISIGDLDEEARDAARTRRKALNAYVEDAMPVVAGLRSKVIAANK